MQNSDAEIEYGMKAAKALGANQVTLEHPSNDAHTLKLGTIAQKYGIKVGYHGHEQQTPTFWDTALAQSSANALNIDLGHFVAAGNQNPLDFIKQKHDKIVSMHIKDRQTPEHGKGNVVWGQGDTPIIEALNLMKTQKYNFPATVEFEYKIPEGSNSVAEVKKCVEYCRKALS
jgi:sugar phosphate isomerase/epimerase